MSPLGETTVAVVVVYHLADSVGVLLGQLAKDVGRIIVVDNSDCGHAALVPIAARFGATLIANGNVGGLAGAYNRALLMLDGLAPPPSHVVFVDEDSDASMLGSLLSDTDVEVLLQRDDTAAVAPAYRDRTTGMRGRYLELDRWRLRYLPREFTGARPVAFVINSMAVWRREALLRIGCFDEWLGIDHIDTDYCLRARAAALRVFVHGNYEFKHSIGERRRFRLFGRDMQAGGHSPARRRLIGRNTVRLALRWVTREPAFAFLCATRLVYEAVGIAVVEPGKAAKLCGLAVGAAQGLFLRSAR